MRPVLKPGLRRLWRDACTLQLGSDPELAVVLGDLHPAAARVVALLDGTKDEAGVVRGAVSAGVAPEEARRLLSVLAQCGALDDAATDTAALRGMDPAQRDRLAPDLAALSLRSRGTDGGLGVLARRREAVVEVRGTGRVGATLAVLLASVGVGALRLLDPAPTRPADVGAGGLLVQDVGRARQDAAADAVRRAAPDALDSRPDTPSDLVVLAPVGAVAAHHAAGVSRIAHLAVGVRDGRGVVGPLVLPGVSSCLHCHDLHRRDRDPAWPRLAAQLATDPDGVVPCEAPLAVAVAALAAVQALTFLDGRDRPAAVDGTLELTLPEIRARRRSWQPHPSCGCAAGGPRGSDLALDATMTG